MKKLSNKTLPQYCVTEVDFVAGIKEIKDNIEERIRSNKKIPSYYYTRIKELSEKLKIIITKGLRVYEFRYQGHVFKADRQFKLYEDFVYVTKRCSSIKIKNWNWSEFYIYAHAIGHENISLYNADIFIMDRDYLVIPMGGHLAKYDAEK